MTMCIGNETRSDTISELLTNNVRVSSPHLLLWCFPSSLSPMTLLALGVDTNFNGAFTADFFVQAMRKRKFIDIHKLRDFVLIGIDRVILCHAGGGYGDAEGGWGFEDVYDEEPPNQFCNLFEESQDETEMMSVCQPEDTPSNSGSAKKSSGRKRKSTDFEDPLFAVSDFDSDVGLKFEYPIITIKSEKYKPESLVSAKSRQENDSTRSTMFDDVTTIYIRCVVFSLLTLPFDIGGIECAVQKNGTQLYKSYQKQKAKTSTIFAQKTEEGRGVCLRSSMTHIERGESSGGLGSNGVGLVGGIHHDIVHNIELFSVLVFGDPNWSRVGPTGRTLWRSVGPHCDRSHPSPYDLQQWKSLLLFAMRKIRRLASTSAANAKPTLLCIKNCSTRVNVALGEYYTVVVGQTAAPVNCINCDSNLGCKFDRVAESDRCVVGGVQNSLQTILDLMTYIMGIIISNPQYLRRDPNVTLLALPVATRPELATA
ncbi:hypothetical protein DH2020_002468 [Rehmannia glutinosa]|uniref:Solute carrier family 40 member n=1 Tax=Rehmannia glutinosa TaxID=99300 RepID=A0ABR0XTT4_REHGL